MPSPKPIRGKILRVDAPEWEPLLNLAPDHVVDFMWMGTVQLIDGTRLQAYKHYWTRDYLHLSEDGRAFVFVPKTKYEEVNPPWLLMRVLRAEPDRSCVILSDRMFGQRKRRSSLRGRRRSTVFRGSGRCTSSRNVDFNLSNGNGNRPAHALTGESRFSATTSRECHLRSWRPKGTKKISW